MRDRIKAASELIKYIEKVSIYGIIYIVNEHNVSYP